MRATSSHWCRSATVQAAPTPSDRHRWQREWRSISGPTSSSSTIAPPASLAAATLTSGELAALCAEGSETRDLPSAARLDALAAACRGGVARAHLIGLDEDGALLRELFSAEGVGTQVSDGDYRVVRAATAEDVDAVAALIRPLEEAGALVRRSRARLAEDIYYFVVAELDGVPTGCCATLPLAADAAEVACLVGGGAAGPLLLDAVEGIARTNGWRRLFALTTQAEDWFLEHGFRAATAGQPSSRPQSQLQLRTQRQGIAQGAAPMTDAKRPYSSIVVDGVEQAPSRAHALPRWLQARGLRQGAGGHRPPPGRWSRRATCTSMRWRTPLPWVRTKPGPRASSSTPSPFRTAFRWARPGMRYSLVSREVIADSIETVVGAQGFDGVVAIGGCDKNMPACAMALARLNRPSVFVYGGTIQTGAERRDIHLRLRGRGRPRGGHGKRRRAAGRGADGHSRPRFLRRHVHRQQHGLRHRGRWGSRCPTPPPRKR